MTLLLDTTVLVDVLRRRNDMRTALEEWMEMGHRLTVCAICVAEVYSGMRLGEEGQTSSLLENLPCYDVTHEIAVLAGNIKCEWSRKGKTLALTDMLIAATAMEHGLHLVTDNRKDFPIPELSFFPLP